MSILPVDVLLYFSLSFFFLIRRDEQNQGKDNPVYDPWGKSGAGAPNRDRTGRVVGQ